MPIGKDDIWGIYEGMNCSRLVWQIQKGDFLCPDWIPIKEDFDSFLNHWGDTYCDQSNGYINTIKRIILKV